jgi:hypothetical protein
MSSEHLKPTGGVGQFAKSFVELMASNNIKVDIITDKEPYDIAFAKSITPYVITPNINKKNNLTYAAHQMIFSHGDSFCYERITNFRNAIIRAMTKNMYDTFICNTYETVHLAATLGMGNFIQMIAYTHLESQIFKDSANPFLDDVNEMMRLQLNHSSIIIGTQSKFNQLNFDHAYELPIPLPEKALLKEHHTPRNGVLFIGRWEEGKNPELFIELIKQTKLPARVITSETGHAKFETAFKKLGIDYKILSGVIGIEKVDFITSCRVAFNPSTVESYGIAFLEQMTQLPTVALENMRWTNNFNSKNFYVCNKKNMATVVNELYIKFDTAQSWYDTESLHYTIDMDSRIFHKWNTCFNDFTPRCTGGKTAGILTHTTIRYDDYIDGLKRDILSFKDDLASVYNNKDKFRIIYTDTDTYLTKDPLFEPSDQELFGLNLFEGL